MYEYAAVVSRVVDGDTVDVTIDLGMETSRTIRCRLFGINAPEKNTPEGKAAKAWLEQRVAGKTILCQTIKDKVEKYGRYLVRLMDGNEINTEMISAGHAKAYFGVGPRI